MKRIPELDGLRGIAILLVLSYHFFGLAASRWNPFAMGWSGVDLFFVLSGFLIGGILLDNRDTANYYRTFYIRRACRIIVPYALTVLLFVPILTPTTGRAVPWYAYPTFTQNIFVALSFSTFMTHLWSLAMEEQFYLLLPPIVRNWSRFIPHLTIAAIAICPLIRIAEWNSAGYIFGHTFPLGRMDSMAYGVLVAWLTRNPHPKIRVAKIIGAVATVALVVFFLCGWTDGQRQQVIYGYSIYGCFYSAMLILTLEKKPAWLRTRALRYFGVRSYSIYLLHVPCWRITQAILPKIGQASQALLACGVTVALASLSWKFLESRLIDFGKDFSYSSRPTRAALAAVATNP